MGEVHEAIEADDADRVGDLVRQNPAVAKERNDAGISALMLTLYRGRPQLGEVLLAAGPELDVHEAAAFGRVGRLRALLDDDPEQVAARSPDTFTPLHYAAFFGRIEAARLLLERGAEVDAVAAGFGSVTPLHSAAAGAHFEICELLLEHGADPNARQAKGFAPLHAAAQHEDERLARLLLDHGADPDAATDDGRRPRDLGLAAVL